MIRALILAATLMFIGIGGASLWVVAGGKNAACSKDGGASDPASCEAGTETAGVAKPTGKVLGRFDPAMAGCRFACATNLTYEAKTVLAQPGVKDGRLTRCPVFGVVLNVDAKRPHVRVGADDYVTCCDTCAEKLRKSPRRFVRV